MLNSCIVLLLFIGSTFAIPIDNGVEGDPEIECGSAGITINFNLRNEFQGHVYVKGRFAEAGCRSDENGRKVAGMTIGFNDCGTDRSRSLNPRGVFVKQTVIITFHPLFLTKVDRAYSVQCFYMEADKTVSQDLEVAEITTGFQSQIVPMPVCRYDILDSGPTGEPVKFATIGQQVYHKWTCDTETTDIFCMTVHSCSVDDGAGNTVSLLTDQGCGIDKHLLQNLEYTTDLMAGRESHVFKFADKPALFFQCQISITIKEPGAECARPQCGEPGGPGAAAVGGAGKTGPPRPAETVSASPHVTGGAKAEKATVKPINTKSSPPPSTPAHKPSEAPAAAVVKPPGHSVQSTGQPAQTTGHPALPTTATKHSLKSTGAAAITTGAPVKTTASPSEGRVLLTDSNSIENSKKNSRNRRSVPHAESIGVWDVKAQPITAFDVDVDQPTGYSLTHLRRSTSRPLKVPTANDKAVISFDYCIPVHTLSLMVGLMGASFVVSVVMVILLFAKKKSLSKNISLC